MSYRCPECERLHVSIEGAVQGVGFRPYVYRLARSLSLTGWVNNSAQGVTIEVEGARRDVRGFLDRLEGERPPQSSIHSLEWTFLDPAGYETFDIHESDPSGTPTAIVLPDIAACDDCVREVSDENDRRYRYPFTNCTNCGPRYSIIASLPYDRRHTTMRAFVMCDECRAEYLDPADRRFHAQPNACPRCGPSLELWDRAGHALARGDEALRRAVAVIAGGGIVALKGLGGFHLVVDAADTGAVSRLRARKGREHRPFAIMYPSLARVSGDCRVEAAERRVLLSAAAPIVLLRRRAEAGVSGMVAPGNPYLGAMLPYTPLHHLLLADFGRPVVATSGNRSEEPICTDERDALERLAGIADVFLVHDRPILRHVDDSIVRIVAGREQVLRRARGYAPNPVPVHGAAGTVLAVGAHQKSAVALGIGERAFAGQHVGDLETPAARDAFEGVIAGLTGLYQARPDAVVCDGHPSYVSTEYALHSGLPVHRVQHHVAHVLACMSENEVDAPVLGVSWDGTGYGSDGTIWGGEFFHVTLRETRRAAHLRAFPLPGGERAIREPRRAAAGLLYEIGALDAANDTPWASSLSGEEKRVLTTMLERGVNSPRTSSAGRLFDAVASLMGLAHVNRFEGEAAMRVEFECALGPAEGPRATAYAFSLCEGPDGRAVLDWEPVIRSLIADAGRGVPAPAMARSFHAALTAGIVMVAERVGETAVVLSGGCFQNARLTEETIGALRGRGFKPYWHQRVPTNDGGIAVGQIAAFAQGRVFDRVT